MAGEGASTSGARGPSRGARLRAAYLSGDAVFAVFLLVIGAVTLTVARTMRLGQAHDPLGGRFFPVMISVVLIVAAVAILLRPLLRVLLHRRIELGQDPGAAPGLEVGQAEDAHHEGLLETPLGRVGAMAVVTTIYIALLDLIGYIPATILGMGGALWVLGVRKLRRLVIGPVVMALSLYLIFTNLLYVRLP